MESPKYNYIENTNQEKTIRAIIDQGFGELEYIVQEKMHGVNLSFITNGRTIIRAKRAALISGSESYYRSEWVLRVYAARIFKLFRILEKDFGIKTMTIFGEIFGGAYPHPDVEKDEEAVSVHSGIYYSPHNDFYAFDILIDNKKYLDVELVNAYFEKTGFFYAKTLFQGSLQACLAYPNDFKTTIPGRLGLPEIEGNQCAGVIIRPEQPHFLADGSRVILNHINEKWRENNKSIDAELLKEIRNNQEENSKEVILLNEEIIRYITRNRLVNVLSKIETVQPLKEFGKVVAMFNQDIWEEFKKDNFMKFELLDKKEQAVIKRLLNVQSRKLIESYFGI